jgi:hypothetical protein
MVHSIVLYVALIIGCATARIFIVCTAPIIISIFTSLLVHYAITLSRMNTVDLALLRYAAQYKCSEGPLQMALEAFEGAFIKDIAIVKVGLSFTVIGIVFFILIFICATPLRECCANCCAERTGIERMRSFAGKPAIETYL